MAEIKKPRVLFCSGVWPPLIGGPATILSRLVPALSVQGYDCSVLTYGQMDKETRPYELVRLPLSRPQPWRFLSLLRQVLKLGRTADVIFAFDSYSHGLGAALAARILNKAMVLRFTGDSAWESDFNQGRTDKNIIEWQNEPHSFRSKLRIWRRNFVLNTAERVVTDCEFLKNLLIKIGIKAEKIIVINNAVSMTTESAPADMEDFKRRHGLKEKVILTIGRLVPWKGIDTLIKIMPRLKKDFPSLSLAIVGDGPQKDYLQKLTAELDLQSEVKFLGTINDAATKQILYNLSDALVQNTFYEGMSNTLLEALGAGAAIVTTRAGGNSELISPGNGILVEYNDAQELAAALKKILSDKDFAANLGKSARQKAREFSWHNLIEHNKNLINSLLKTKVCFIVPQTGRGLATHAAYLSDFIVETGRYLNAQTIVESELKFKFLPGRIMETFYRCFRARRAGCRIFYVHYSYAGALCAKAVTSMFGGRVFYWNCGMMWLFGKKRFLRFLLNRVVDFLVTGNETIKQGYHENLGVRLEKIKIMPNWVDLEKFNVPEEKIVALRRELNIPASAPVVLFLHRLSPRKGSRYLPEIITQTIKNIPQTHFIIAGSGPDQSWLKEKIGQNAQIHFVGAWPNERVAELMAGSDVFIMPSEEEGFPRVIIEAQAAGLPFAAFDIGGTKEISPAESHDFIKTVGDTSGLAKDVERLLRLPPNERQRLSDTLQNHVKQYDRKAVAKIFAAMVSHYDS